MSLAAAGGAAALSAGVGAWPAGAAAVAGQEGAGAGFHPVFPWLILALPLLGAAVNGLGAFLWRDDKRIPSIVGPAALLGSFAVVLVNFIGMSGAELHGAEVVRLWSWIVSGDLSIGVDLQFDQLSMLMCMIVTGVGSLIHIYSVGYMRDDPGYSRYFSYLNLFVFFMLVLVLGASFPLMFVGWEGVGLCSYLLIGFWYENREYANAGKKAFIMNRIGDAGFLVAMFLVFTAFGTLDFVPVLAAADGTLAYGGALVTGITLLLFLGCTGKSAQIPLHTWLPDAMAGPTPVSALIHAATMVTAGVYLIARTSVLFALSPVSQGVVAAVGAGTALFAASIAIRQYDIKKVLAYSTISQLGYMFLAVGVGAFTAGVFHLMTHAFFKALLFLGAGAVIHAVHHAWAHGDDGHGDGHGDAHHGDPNDMRNHGGLRKFMPRTFVFMWIATLAIAGVPPLAGFFSKDEIIWYSGAYGYPILWGVALATALLTAVYMARLMVLTFHGGNRTFGHGGAAEAGRRLHEVPAVMWAPLAVLAVLSVVGGWANIPEALPLLPTVEWLHHWLEPVFAPAIAVKEAHGFSPEYRSPVGGGEAFWAGVSAGIAIAAVVWTVRALSPKPVPTEAEAVAPTGFARVLHDKWYVDELYDRAIVRPSLALWRACWRIVDAGIIDGAVNGAGRAARLLGWAGGQLQTGRVTTYLVAFMLGALLVLGVLS
ncbi:NADH-quinone oxidoreductase subunit L [Candidatus Palauibacter sp.]|uniref:NADH-quinone oxidoreductase subunit L n=1 Tax=Candidatus Palauibacter sp. TaxID=3101350 RepID=UPI003B021E86